MAHYLIGDIQGCHAALQQLLQAIDFSPSRDKLYPLGDLVNRGEDSLGVLQTLMRFGASCQVILGNHDLHLLAIAAGVRPQSKHDTLQAILDAPTRPALLDWLCGQALAKDIVVGNTRWLLIHAGVLPQWSVEQTLELSRELESVLQSASCGHFLHQMYGNTPNLWQNDLQGSDRLRVVVNALTRLRFCTAQGEMEFATKESANAAPSGYVPWFKAYGGLPIKTQQQTRIAFGHWSTLGLNSPSRVFEQNGYLCLDTGCVWGGPLTAYELETDRLTQVANTHSVQVF